MKDTHRLVCFDELCLIFDTCRANGLRIPLAEATAMVTSCDNFLVHYNWLAHNSMSRGDVNYNITTKCHTLWHLCYHARFLNPKAIWCFEFEDFVGTIITCAKGCMAGSPLRIVGRKTLENFLLVLQLRVSR